MTGSQQPDASPHAKPLTYVARMEAQKMMLRDADGRLLSLCTTPTKFGAGTGVAAYFSLLQALVLIFFLCVFLAVGEMYIYYRVNPFDITDYHEWEQAIIRLSIGNYVIGLVKRANVTAEMATGLTADEYPMVVSFPWASALLDMGVCLVYGLVVYRFRTKKVDQIAAETDQRAITPEDYSVVVDGLPPTIKEAGEVASMLRQYGPIHSVLLAYSLTEWAPLQAQLNEAFVQYTLAAREEHSPCAPTAHDEERDVRLVDTTIDPNLKEGKITRFLRAVGLHKDLVYWKKTLAGLMEKRRKLQATQGSNPLAHDSAQLAFVIFKRSQDAQKCIDGCRKGIRLALEISGRKRRFLVTVTRAPEPSDVRWENLSKRGWRAWLRSKLANLVAAVVTLVGFAIFFALMFAKNTAARLGVGGSVGTFGVSIAYSVIVFVLGVVIRMIFSALASFECAHTRTQASIDLIEKQWVTSFFNSAGILFVFSAIFPPGSSAADSLVAITPTGFLRYPWYLDTATSLAMVILLACVQELVMQVLLPADWLPAIILRMKAKTQLDLNMAYKPYEFPLPVLFGTILNLILVTMFISALVPVVLPVVFLFVVLYYWVLKYNLLRRCRVPSQYAKTVAAKVAEVLPLGIHLHCIAAGVIYFLTVHLNLDLITENYAKSAEPLGPEGRGFLGSAAGWVVVGYYGSIIVFWLARGLPWTRRLVTFLEGCICRRTPVEPPPPHPVIVGPHPPSVLKKDDETRGTVFTDHEPCLQTYIDLHPCYTYTWTYAVATTPQDPRDVAPLRSNTFHWLTPVALWCRTGSGDGSEVHLQTGWLAPMVLHGEHPVHLHAPRSDLSHTAAQHPRLRDVTHTHTSTSLVFVLFSHFSFWTESERSRPAKKRAALVLDGAHTLMDFAQESAKVKAAAAHSRAEGHHSPELQAAEVGGADDQAFVPFLPSRMSPAGSPMMPMAVGSPVMGSPMSPMPMGSPMMGSPVMGSPMPMATQTMVVVGVGMPAVMGLPVAGGMGAPTLMVTGHSVSA
ncbi:hypothetical protein PAPYR_7251 [Paratrimastix pyriformis]|uniref:CSC1/OSCA1-like cytosolic domain-containing protein n=1 Tax=Paratrimastix pyriformis TaxID=342808 RepID=A0ABQ8UG22_9EUKA|nr:hypothetical protein PAPYR_7251 [Paratrimastix pyriformis]